MSNLWERDVAVAPGRYVGSSSEEEMFAPAASLPTCACLPPRSSCQAGKKLEEERGELPEGPGTRQALLGRAGDRGKQAGCPGTSGAGAGCPPDAVVWPGAALELAWPWPRGCVPGEFAGMGSAGLVLPLPRVPRGYLLRHKGSAGSV